MFFLHVPADARRCNRQDRGVEWLDHWPPLKGCGPIPSPLDVPLLGAFVAPNQQNHPLLATLGVIHPITRTHIDAKFGDAVGQVPVVTRVAVAQPTDPSQDTSAADHVLQAIDPGCELRGALDFHTPKCSLQATTGQ
jgi:hypothetical protein